MDDPVHNLFQENRRDPDEALGTYPGLSADAAISLNQVLEAILSQAMAALEASDGTLMLPDEEGNLHFMVRKGGHTIAEAKQVFRRGEGVAGQVYQTGRPYLCVDTETDPRFVPIVGGLPIRSIVSVPITLDTGTVIGVINVDSTAPQKFSEADGKTLSALAKSAALSIERAQLLEGLREVSEHIGTGAADLQNRIVEVISRLTHCPASLWRTDNAHEQASIVASHRVSAEYAAHAKVALESSVVGKAIRAGKILEVPDIQEEPDFQFKEGAAREGWRSMLAVPLLVGPQQAVGALSIYGLAKRDRFTPWELGLLNVFSGHAALAIQEVERLELMRRLGEIGRAISTLQSSPEVLEQTLEQIANAAREALGADIVDLYRYYPDRGTFDIPPIMVGTRRLEKIVTEILPDDVVSQIAQSGQPIYASDAQNHPMLTAKWTSSRDDRPSERFVIRESIVSSAGIPLKVESEVVGVLYVSYRQRRDFDAETDLEERCEIFASYAATSIQNADLYQREQQRAEAMALLQEINTKISSALELQKTLESIVDGAIRLTRATSGTIHLLKDDGRALDRSISRPESFRHPAPRLDNPDGTTYKIIHGTDKRPVVVSDLSAISSAPPDLLEQKVRSLIGVSLILEGEILGVLYLNSIYPGHFSNAQITSMVSTLADQAAIAIDNARLRREQLTALQEIGSDIAHITSELNLNLLLDEIVKHACELLHNASNGTIQLFDESSNELVVEAHIGDVIKSEYANVRLKMGEGLTGWVAQNRKTARVGNINKDERCLAYLAGTNSEVAVPLLYDDELIGVLNVEHQKYGAFSEEDQKLLEVIGNQAAIAINNARLYSQLAEKNQHLDRKIRDLKAVYKVSQQLTAAVRMSEQDVLALIHEQVSQLMDAENMYIALYDEATDTVRFPLVFVDSQPWPVAPRSGGKGRTEWILKHREPIFIETRDESVAWYEKYGQEYIGEPFASWIGVPMMAGDKVLGVIATYHKTRDYVYTTDDQEVLELMASQAAIVLQNARMWEAMQKLSEDLSGGAALDVE